MNRGCVPAAAMQERLLRVLQAPGPAAIRTSGPSLGFRGAVRSYRGGARYHPEADSHACQTIRRCSGVFGLARYHFNALEVVREPGRLGTDTGVVLRQCGA